MIIPNYNIEPGQYDPEEIVDVVPEQAESNRKIQASEDNYLRQLETNEEHVERLRRLIYRNHKNC